MTDYNILLQQFRDLGAIEQRDIDILNQHLNKIVPEERKNEAIKKLNEMAERLLVIDEELNRLEVEKNYQYVMTTTQINQTFRILQYNALFNYIINLIPECEKMMKKMVNDLNRKLIKTNSIIASKIRMKTGKVGGIFVDRDDAMEMLEEIIDSGLEDIRASVRAPPAPASAPASASAQAKSSTSSRGGPFIIANSIESYANQLLSIKKSQSKFLDLPQESKFTYSTLLRRLDEKVKKESNEEKKRDGLILQNHFMKFIKNEPLDKKDDEINSIINKYTREQIGGGNLKQFRDTVLEQKLKKVVKIYNTDVMLKLANIISDKDSFTEFFTRIYSKRFEVQIVKLFLDNFFLEISNKTLIDFLDLQSNINRDTKIVNNILGDTSKQYIFVFQFVNKLVSINTKTFQRLMLTDEILSELGFIFSSILEKVKNLKDVFERVQNQTLLINFLYDDIMKKSKRVFTYVKKRLNEEESERFKFTNLQNNTVLKLDYTNTVNKNEKLSGEEKETYYFGTFDNIFEPTTSNETVAKELLKDVGRRIENREDICIIGYGASGAGKTSTLVRLTTTGQDGIIVELLKLKEITNNFKKIKLSAIEILINPNSPPNNENVKQDQYAFRDLIQLEKTLEIFDSIDESKKEFRGVDITKNIVNFPHGIKKESTAVYDIKRSKLQVTDKFQNNISFTTNETFWATSEDKGNWYADIPDKNIKTGIFNLDEETFNPEEINFNLKGSSWEGSLNITKEKQIFLNEKYKFEVRDISTSKNLGDYITFLLTLRKEKPTPNNPNSSRSHVVIKLDLYQKIDDIEKSSSIILCDFAGVENKFLCEDENTLTKFIGAYKKSTVKFPFSQFDSDVEPLVKDELFKLVHEGKNKDCEKAIDKFLPISDKTKYLLDNLEKLLNFSNEREIIIDSNLQEFVKKNFLQEKTRDNWSSNDFSVKNKFSSKLFEAILSNQSRFTPINEKQVEYTTNFRTYLYNEIKKLKSSSSDPVCQETVNSRIKSFCNTRLTEGYLINHSLGDMRTDIKGLMLASIKGDREFLPIFSDTSIYPYCRNLFLDSEYFNTFYDATDSEFSVSGQILKLFKKLKIDNTKLIFVLFTVINLNAEANNPPPVPYFNVSPLIYNLESGNQGKTEEEFEILIKKIKSYKKEPIYVNIIEDILSNAKDAKSLANAVKKTNAATLIGSLESTVMLQSLTFSQFSCNKMEDEPDTIIYLLDLGFDINLEAEQKYFKKYLKYKQKYQLLKNKL